jgi:hypothetical protein
MTEVVIISRDAALRQRIQSPRISWVQNPAEFELAIERGLNLVLIDVCLDCGPDIAKIVHDCRKRGNAHRVVAFLSGCAGEDAIKAHLAGADRVIPVDQLEDELTGLLPD